MTVAVGLWLDVHMTNTTRPYSVTIGDTIVTGLATLSGAHRAIGRHCGRFDVGTPIAVLCHGLVIQTGSVTAFGWELVR